MSGPKTFVEHVGDDALAKKIGKPGIVRRDNASYGIGARCAT